MVQKNGNELRNLFWLDIFQTLLDISIFAVNVHFFQKLLHGKYLQGVPAYTDTTLMLPFWRENSNIAAIVQR